ncbi:MAG: phosphoribosylglycinamide formyltransferase [Thaumarchaeota archaeon]|nr:phosphoribosylglycinamide formyltransferase [Nitrososphaerota archaeon]
MALKLGILVSGRGTNMASIIEAVQTKQIPQTEVAVVITSNPGALALEIARSFSIPIAVVDSLSYKNRRREFDIELAKELAKHGVTPKEGLVVLAGFMRILGADLVKQYAGRIMNIHPSLLPSFPGLHAQKQALEYGAKVSGCTVHFVEEGVDTGPIIIQSAVTIRENEMEETLAARILEQEHRIYPEAIQYFAEGRILIEGHQVSIRE